MQRISILVNLAALALLASCATSPTTSLPADSEPSREAAGITIDDAEAAIGRARAAAGEGLLAEAESLLEEVSTALAQLDGDPRRTTLLIEAETALADVVSLAGRSEEAVIAMERALALVEADESVPPETRVAVQANRGVVLMRSGRFASALGAFTDALGVNAARPQPDPGIAARLHAERATAYGALNDPVSAIAELRRAAEIASPLDTRAYPPGFLGMVYLRLVEQLRLQGRWWDAVAPAERAVISLQIDGRRPDLLADAHYFLGTVRTMTAGEQSARSAYLDALEMYEQMRAPNLEFMGVASYNVARSYHAEGDSARALRYFRLAAQAYGARLAELVAAAERVPGSVPLDVINSYERRLADAEREIDLLEGAE